MKITLYINKLFDNMSCSFEIRNRLSLSSLSTEEKRQDYSPEHEALQCQRYAPHLEDETPKTIWEPTNVPREPVLEVSVSPPPMPSERQSGLLVFNFMDANIQITTRIQ